MNSIDARGKLLLDNVYTQIMDERVAEGMDKLLFGLLKLRSEFLGETWSRFATGYCRDHPLMEVVLQSPLARRAYQKPRGYTGDAIMMDYIYGNGTSPENPTKELSAIYHYEFNTLAGKSVRERKSIAARYVDEIAAKKTDIRVLSLASGHLREAQESQAVKNGLVKEYIAFDQDEKSLAVVEREQCKTVVRTFRDSISSILKRKVRFDNLDLVYSLGLFDYLTQRTATVLTLRVFEMLNSGGRLLIANFAPNLHTIGYMEAYMDWYLIYRDEFEVEDLTGKIPRDQLADMRIFRDSYKNLIFLDLEKK